MNCGFFCATIQLMEGTMALLIDAILDTIKLIPFLFITYIVIEWIEHKASEKIIVGIQKTAKFGPLLGSGFGLLPQCGFSSIASTLYVTRVLSLGTLIAIYLSTSDEMLPIMISNQAPLDLIVKILSIKFIVGVVIGYLIDLLLRKKKKEEIHIDNFCENEECHCDEDGIFVSAIKHTLRISFYIFIITLILNIGLNYINLETVLLSSPFMTTIISAFVGLIPNCAASIVITQLYLDGLMSFGSMMAGLLTNAGVGLLILFRINRNLKENFGIVGILLVVGIIVGLLF